MIGRPEHELTQDERNKLEQFIDRKFRAVILEPREALLIDFFIKVQSLQFEYRVSGDTNALKVLEVYYYVNCPLGFIAVEPSNDIYDPAKTTNRPELKMNKYAYSHIDDIVINVLDENQIDYKTLKDEGEFDTAMFWENQSLLEIQFIVNCWQKATENTNSKIIAFLMASDASGGIIDLRNGYNLLDDNLDIPAYLRKQNEKIETESTSPLKRDEPGFWRRLFGRKNNG
ncbi:MAG: hypothetical protein AAF502_17560 [Bacteroidota bacterium]